MRRFQRSPRAIDSGTMHAPKLESILEELLDELANDSRSTTFRELDRLERRFQRMRQLWGLDSLQGARNVPTWDVARVFFLEHSVIARNRGEAASPLDLEASLMGAGLAPLHDVLPRTFWARQPILILQSVVAELEMKRTARALELCGLTPASYPKLRGRLCEIVFPALRRSRARFRRRFAVAAAVLLAASLSSTVDREWTPQRIAGLTAATGLLSVCFSVGTGWFFIAVRRVVRTPQPIQLDRLSAAQSGALGAWITAAILGVLGLQMFDVPGPLVGITAASLSLLSMAGFTITQTRPRVLYLAASGADSPERCQRVAELSASHRVVSLIDQLLEKPYGGVIRFGWSDYIPRSWIHRYSRLPRADALDNLRQTGPGSMERAQWLARIRQLVSVADLVVFDAASGITRGAASELDVLTDVLDAALTLEGDAPQILILEDRGTAPLLAFAGNAHSESRASQVRRVRTAADWIGPIESLGDFLAGSVSVGVGKERAPRRADNTPDSGGWD